MTKTLIIKMFRDLRQNFIQFVAIFLMSFFALFALAGIDGEGQGQLVSTDRYYRETNFMDLYATSEGFTREDLTTVRNLSTVSDASINGYLTGTVNLGYATKKIGLTFLQEDRISKLMLFDGEPYEADADGIWIDRNFAAAQHIGVGDVLTLRANNLYFSEIVKGIVDSPDFMSFVVDETYTEPHFGDYGYAFLDAKEYPGDIRYERMNVKVKGVGEGFPLSDEDSILIEEAKMEIMRSLSKTSLAVTTKAEDAGYEMVRTELDTNEMLTAVFPTMFVLVALLGIMTTMSRMMARQRTLIGALKALGFSRGTIMIHYISYVAIIVLAGCILGSILGYRILSPSFTDAMNLYVSSPYSAPSFPPSVYRVTAIVVVFSALVSFCTCRKLLVQTASEILRPEPPKAAGAGWLEKTFIWEKLDFATRWNLRDMNLNRARTVMGMMGVVLCTALMFTAFAYNEFLNQEKTWTQEVLTPANYKVSFAADTPYSTVYDYARQYDGQMVMLQEMELMSDSVQRLYNVAVPDHGNLYHVVDFDGKYMDLPEYGVGISEKASRVMEAGVGDSLRFRLTGEKKWHLVKISCIYKSSTQGIIMRREVFEGLGFEFKPNFVHTNRTVPASLTTERTEVASVISKEQLILSAKLTGAAVDSTVVYIMMIAIVVGIVVMYNMGILSFMEKVREIATLKVLGFPTNRIRWILQQQNLVITGIGVLLGMPLGVQLLDFICDEQDPKYDYLLQITFLPFVCSFLLTFVLSVIINAILSTKVRDINMVEALKGVD